MASTYTQTGQKAADEKKAKAANDAAQAAKDTQINTSAAGLGAIAAAAKKKRELEKQKKAMETKTY